MQPRNSKKIKQENSKMEDATLLSHTEWARIKEKAPKLTLDTQNMPCLRTYSGHNIQPL